MNRRALTFCFGAVACGNAAELPELDVPEVLSTAPYAVAKHVAVVGDVVGVNEAISVPTALAERGQFTLERRLSEWGRDLDLLQILGVRRTRVNSATSPHLSQWALKERGGDFSRSDAYLRLLFSRGIEPIVVIGPWPGNRTALYTDTYIPSDLAAYRAYVTAVVERYDGDGEADVLGEGTRVRFWEVDNEPDLHHRVLPAGAAPPRQPFLTPDQYAAVYAETSAAVRASDPSAVLLNGGLFDTGNAQGAAYLRAVEKALETRGVPSFDALSVHAYFDDQGGEGFLRAMDAAQSLANGRPVFVTETGVPSDGRKAWADEDWQARMLAFVLGESLARGVEGVYWQGLVGPPGGRERAKGSPGGFASHPLFEASKDDAPARARPAVSLMTRWLEAARAVPLEDVRHVALNSGRAVALGDAGIFLYSGSCVLPSGMVAHPLGSDEALAGEVNAPAWLTMEGG